MINYYTSDKKHKYVYIIVMQDLGYIFVDSKKVKVLARQGKFGRFLKIRNSGKYGIFFLTSHIILIDVFQRKTLYWLDFLFIYSKE